MGRPEGWGCKSFLGILSHVCCVGRRRANLDEFNSYPKWGKLWAYFLQKKYVLFIDFPVILGPQLNTMLWNLTGAVQVWSESNAVRALMSPS
jgi:hypothetical protein